MAKQSNFFNSIKTLGVSTLLLSCCQFIPAEAMDVLPNVEDQPKKEYNFTPVPRGQVGHEEMKEAYKSIKYDNDRIVAENLTLGQAKSNKYKFNELPRLQGGNHETVLEITAQDTITSAMELIGQGHKTFIMNFASKRHPGGGYEDGTLAQEEDICRRTDLYYTIKPMYDQGKYPIEHDEVIYSSGVKIIRNDYSVEYTLLNQAYSIGVVTIPAFNINFSMKSSDLSLFNVSKEKYFNFTDEKIENMKYPEKKPIFEALREAFRIEPTISQPYENCSKEKIRATLRIAGQDGSEVAVLGAFGCGVFENPPSTMARLFSEVLAEQEFIGFFKVIRFSILSKDPSKDGNILSFKTELSKTEGYKFGQGFVA